MDDISRSAKTTFFRHDPKHRHRCFRRQPLDITHDKTVEH